MLKILFVDSNVRFAAVTVKTFLSGHQVTVVPSMEGAREFLRAEPFDVLLLDYDLEDGKGDELVYELKGRPHHPLLIAVSAHAPSNKALLDAGADAACSKMEFKNIEGIIADAQTATTEPKGDASKALPSVIKPLGASAIIFNRMGHVLLVQQSYGNFNWELPGGAVEEGESIVDAAIREVRQETRWRVVAERTVGIYYDALTDLHHFTFECRAAEEVPFQMSDEITQCAFWPVENLPRPISDFTVQRIRDALSSRGPALPINVGPDQWLM